MSFVADLVDAALEWSVFGSFTRLGSALRRAAVIVNDMVGRSLLRKTSKAQRGLGVESGPGSKFPEVAGRSPVSP